MYLVWPFLFTTAEYFMLFRIERQLSEMLPLVDVFICNMCLLTSPFHIFKVSKDHFVLTRCLLLYIVYFFLILHAKTANPLTRNNIFLVLVRSHS